MKKQMLILATAFLIGSILAARAEAPSAETIEIWNKQCVKCHGKEGKGDTKMGKKIKAANFTDPEVQEKFSDEQMFNAIKEGVKDKSDRFKMKPAADVTDEQINDLVLFIRTLKK